MLDERDKKGSDGKPTTKWIFFYTVASETTLSIVGSAVLGLWVDRRFGLAPWGTIGLLSLGFALAFINLIRLQRGHRLPE
ncbi:MAG: AtpZ/AtpI family protein [Nitrospirae bacterium]|nr:AtpZ/AtpI family protein [Nitrospirota bacterium]